MDFREMSCEAGIWMEPVQDYVRWQTVSTVFNLLVLLTGSSKRDIIVIIISPHFWGLKQRSFIHARFEVLMALAMKSTIFRDVMPCSLVDLYRHVRGMLPLSSG
jgi:hypothetical protein